MTPRRYDINLRALSLLWFLAPLIANHEEAISRGVSWEQRSLFVLSGYLITGILLPASGGIPSALLLAALSPHLSSVLVMFGLVFATLHRPHRAVTSYLPARNLREVDMNDAGQNTCPFGTVA